jgi:hypothetical protein
VRALLPLVEPTLGPDTRQIRDALSRLQMEYARLAGAGGEPAAEPPTPPAEPGAKPEEGPDEAGDESPRPGPAESSGRLWVPGR